MSSGTVCKCRAGLPESRGPVLDSGWAGPALGVWPWCFSRVRGGGRIQPPTPRLCCSLSPSGTSCPGQGVPGALCAAEPPSRCTCIFWLVFKLNTSTLGRFVPSLSQGGSASGTHPRLPNGDAGAKSLCLTVTQVPSPCAQPAAATTVESELREQGAAFGLFFSISPLQRNPA